MRRRAGIGGLQKDAALREGYRAAGDALAEEQRSKLREQADALRANVEAFAAQHRDAIAANPALSARFQRICTAVGVDPLVSARERGPKATGGLLSSLFKTKPAATPGAFHLELAVQTVEQCMLLADQTGGLTDASLIRQRLLRVHNRSDLTEYAAAAAILC